MRNYEALVRALREHNGSVLLFAPDGLAPGKDVTHWMPLPEPPRKEFADGI